MRLVCATHGHCFDGMASAVAFTRLVRTLDSSASFEYRSCGYGANQRRADAELLNGDQNAILDYRFTNVPGLTWYFDHHKTAFASDEDYDAFRERAQGEAKNRFFFDPSYSSCTKLIADVARSHFELDLFPDTTLLEWADRIDAARFDSAEEAADRSHPVMQLVSVVEHHGDDRFLQKVVPELLKAPVEQVALSPFIQKKYRKLRHKHDKFTQRVEERGQVMGRVVLVDLTDGLVDGVSKFVTYAKFPETTYSVVIGLLSGGVKISVGYNPWSGHERDVDISALCSRWGGGGHPVVGGISFARERLDEARAVAREIVEELAIRPTNP